MHRKKNYLIATLLSSFFTLSVFAATQYNRPNPEKGPTEIRVRSFVIDLKKISTVDQTFMIDIVVAARWYDSRVAHLGKGYEPRGRKVSRNEIWFPDITVLNAVSGRADFDPIARVHEDGLVEYIQRFMGVASSPLDLRFFPFDHQELPLSIVWREYDPSEVSVVYETVNSGVADKFTVAGWSFDSWRGEGGKYRMVLSEGNAIIERPQFKLTMTVKRDYRFFIWKVFAPLTIIVLMSWAVFWINPSQMAVQIGVASTSILTLVAFLLTLGAFLPRISYLTVLDRFAFAALALVFLAFVEALMTCTMAAKGRIKLAQRIDLFSRFAFPLAFFGIIFLVLKNTPIS